jgi:hypothetical protein
MDETGLNPQFVEPVFIQGKPFERADIQSTVRETVNVLKRGFNKPKEAKSRHAKFVCDCVDLGYAVISGSDYRWVKSLTQ